MNFLRIVGNGKHDTLSQIFVPSAVLIAILQLSLSERGFVWISVATWTSSEYISVWEGLLLLLASALCMSGQVHTSFTSANEAPAATMIDRRRGWNRNIASCTGVSARRWHAVGESTRHPAFRRVIVMLTSMFLIAKTNGVVPKICIHLVYNFDVSSKKVIVIPKISKESWTHSLLVWHRLLRYLIFFF